MTEAERYSPVFTACTCGCNSSGWFVCGIHGWRSQYAVNFMAAQLAANLLNNERITENELDIIWSLQSDWDEMAADIIGPQPTSSNLN